MGWPAKAARLNTEWFRTTLKNAQGKRRCFHRESLIHLRDFCRQSEYGRRHSADAVLALEEIEPRLNMRVTEAMPLINPTEPNRGSSQPNHGGASHSSRKMRELEHKPGAASPSAASPGASSSDAPSPGTSLEDRRETPRLPAACGYWCRPVKSRRRIGAWMVNLSAGGAAMLVATEDTPGLGKRVVLAPMESDNLLVRNATPVTPTFGRIVRVEPADGPTCMIGIQFESGPSPEELAVDHASQFVSSAREARVLRHTGQPLPGVSNPAGGVPTSPATGTPGVAVMAG